MKSNKVMLITGATSGVGKALAEHYYKKNYKLILVGGSKEKVDKQSKKFKKNTLFICADLTKSKDVKRIVSESITKFKKIDILIANAGLYEPDKIISGNPDRWERVISVNVTSVFRLINLVLPHMKKINLEILQLQVLFQVTKQSIGSQFIVRPNMLFNLLPTVSELKFLKIILGLSP
jgi:NADP-dependent 3-hydroxy acid dehydrogenase YdfG